jgi:hydrogenase nickel incorporation protein HypA/HybF
VHELGLSASVVDAVERRAGTRRVAQVKVRVGSLLHVHPEAFDQSFAIAAMGTIAEGADAELVVVSPRAVCNGCGASWEADEMPLTCPLCASAEIDLTGGDDLVLESITYCPEGP